METVAASVIAVAGTLLGAGVTHAFQRRAQDRTESTARQERLRQERMDAYCAYAGLLVSLRRVLMTRWFCAHENRPADEAEQARHHSYSLRNEAQEALFRVMMLTADESLVRQAKAAFDQVLELHHTDGAGEFAERRRVTKELVEAFVVGARRDVGGR
ncbi:hypothetical protein [Streptomyces sp. TRM68416]|uniref:hypothetical protein n=1 Tax=Streptomyces sp. TRM68416 TaxID=2758412 RepID=UPI001661966B|nr:hypothetical protein [Streptomyces sp. TRM68416]MBD0840229.1 hypothetical protein [Streptomyces sp. TRM68416]